jgi:hypothetical protein
MSTDAQRVTVRVQLFGGAQDGYRFETDEAVTAYRFLGRLYVTRTNDNGEAVTSPDGELAADLVCCDKHNKTTPCGAEDVCCDQCRGAA